MAAASPLSPARVVKEEERGAALLSAKKAALEQEQKRVQVAHRLQFLAAEEERLRKEIGQTRARTEEQKELQKRSATMREVGSSVRRELDNELEHRRKVVSDQRQQNRAAIERKRLALLDARHADFMAKKASAQQAREVILAARAAKQQQKRAMGEAVRQQQQTARMRNSIIHEARAESQNAQTEIEEQEEAAKVAECVRMIDQLSAQESRLLNSVLETHRTHRTEFEALKKRGPSFQRGVMHTTADRRPGASPTPLATPMPYPPGSPMLDRRPATSLSTARRATPAAAFGNSGGIRRIAHSPASSLPGSPRAMQSGSGYATPRAVPSRPPSSPAGAPGVVFREEKRPGGTCMASSPLTARMGATPQYF